VFIWIRLHVFSGRIDKWQKGGRKTCMFGSWEAYEKFEMAREFSFKNIFSG